MIKYIRIGLLFIILLSGQMAWGHATGENYAFIDIKKQSIEGHFEINFINLENDLKLKINTENTLQSVQQTAAIVQKHILEHYAIFADGQKLAINFTRADILTGDERGFAQYYFTAAVDSMPDKLVFQNTLFFANNQQHRGLLLVAYNHKTNKNYGAENTALIFSPNNYRQTLDLNDIPQLLKRREFMGQGVLHILVGYDHILFLIALLLPAVLQRKAGQWQAAANFRTVLFNFITIITLFTVAHSITLTLAALGIIKVYPPLVEAVIALSIILVALNNFIPKFNDRTWLLILVFGLFHGLGFASVMGQLPFRMVDLVHVMLYFNIGVEVGQLAIVAVLLPTLYFLSKHEQFYQQAVLKVGSIVIGLIAGGWFIERAFLSYGLG